MDILEIIKTRRSCRKFKEDQIKDEDLIKVLEAGTFAATGHGTQEPWIVAVQNKDLLMQLAKMNMATIAGENITKVLGSTALKLNANPYYNPPTIILVFADKDNPNNIKDASLVLGNMMLQAHALGLGTCWINREDEMFETAEGKDMIKFFGLPENIIGVGALSIGYWDGTPKPQKPRKEGYYRIIK